MSCFAHALRKPLVNATLTNSLEIAITHAVRKARNAQGYSPRLFEVGVRYARPAQGMSSNGKGAHKLPRLPMFTHAVRKAPVQTASSDSLGSLRCSCSAQGMRARGDGGGGVHVAWAQGGVFDRRAPDCVRRHAVGGGAIQTPHTHKRALVRGALQVRMGGSSMHVSGQGVVAGTGMRMG